MRLKVSSAKRRPFCLGLNELNQDGDPNGIIKSLCIVSKPILNWYTLFIGLNTINNTSLFNDLLRDEIHSLKEGVGSNAPQLSENQQDYRI